ncbi:hypothetical protein JXR93_04035 [bacterium]|nr:hypothetical protein [bacterium]
MRLVPESKNHKRGYPSLKKYFDTSKKILFSAVSIGAFLNPLYLFAGENENSNISKPLRTKGIMMRPTTENDFQKDFKENHLDIKISTEKNDLLKLSLKKTELNFKVILSNNFSKKLKIWNENNSWGYDKIYFQINIDGEIFTIKLKDRGWDKNAPTYRVLSSKAIFEKNILIDSENWDGFPNKPSKKATIKAIYEVKKDEKSEIYNVWSGKIESNEILVEIIE